MKASPSPDLSDFRVEYSGHAFSGNRTQWRMGKVLGLVKGQPRTQALFSENVKVVV